MISQAQRNNFIMPRVSAVTMSLLMLTLTAACSKPNTPVWLMEDLDSCQKSIESEGFKLEKKIFGALKKCTDTYRQKVVDGDPVSDAAPACETALGKVLTFPDVEGKSAMAKAKTKLDSLTLSGGKCSGDQLVALGHPPTATFGDLWARLIMVQSLKQAVEHMTALVGDAIDIFAQLQTAGCIPCAQIASSPCARATCRLVAGSQMYLVQPGTPFSMSGDLSLDACGNTSILGNDVAIFSGLKQPLQQISLVSGYGECVRFAGARGFIAGAASSRPTVAVETCADHVAGDGDECPALLGGVPACSSPQADLEHPGVTNAGQCLQLNTSAPAVGESFLFGAVESRSVCTPGTCAPDTRGPDATACTDDDINPLARYAVPLTTDSAESSVLDADNMDGNVISLGGSITGLPVAIDVVDKRFSGTWVTALPGLHAYDNSPLPDSDETALLTLVCD